MATIQEILDKINASKSNNVNNNSFIDLMRQISGNPEDAIAPVNDTNSIYGHIVQMYTTLYDSGVDYAILADEGDMLKGVYDHLIAINSVYADKTKLDSIYADKLTLDSLYADKDKLDQLFADKAIIDRVYGSIDNIDRVHTSIDKLDAVYADILNIDTVSNNLANIDIVAESDDNITIVADNVTDVNVVADNMTVLNEIYNNRVEIYSADDNAAIATTKAAEASASATAGASSASAAAASASTSTTKASEASASAATALGYKNDVSAMKLAVETIYDTFDDRFLGTKTTNPTLDNDGNVLIDGAMYFNTTDNTMKVYDVGTTTWYSIPQIYLSGLLDVELISITTGDMLVWNGVKWVNVLLTKASIGLANVDNTSDTSKPVSTAQQTALNLKANLASPTFTGTVSGVTKAMVGLGSADNTADSAKNVLSATKLSTARTINGVSFNGTANITVYDSTKAPLTNAALVNPNINGIAQSGYTGFKNLIINGKKQVNQSGITTTDNAYNYDNHYKVGNNWFMFIEGLDIVSGEAYTLSWTGTATASYYIGTAGSSTINAQTFNPVTNGGTITPTITNNQFLWIKFASDLDGSTYNKVQFEKGTVATSFENRPYGFELCLVQMVYETGSTYGVSYGTSAAEVQRTITFYKVTKRVLPIVTVTKTSGDATGGIVSYGTNNMHVISYAATGSSQEWYGTFIADARP